MTRISSTRGVLPAPVITFPTDAELLHAAIKGLNGLARKQGIRLR
jgi:hypothetical protein